LIYNIGQFLERLFISKKSFNKVQAQSKSETSQLHASVCRSDGRSVWKTELQIENKSVPLARLKDMQSTSYVKNGCQDELASYFSPFLERLLFITSYSHPGKKSAYQKFGESSKKSPEGSFVPVGTIIERLPKKIFDARAERLPH
jgi:hypothetical protein